MGYVSEIERAGRTLKERVRAIKHNAGFNACRTINESFVKIGGTATNGEPRPNCYDKRSPREIFMNCKMDAKIDLRVAPGTYCQVTARDTDNTVKSRTIDAIALEPIRNNKGSYSFFSN